MVRFACRHEAARRIDDVLSRRSRALYLDAAAAADCITAVGAIMAEELQWPAAQQAAMLAEAGRAAALFRLA